MFNLWLLGQNCLFTNGLHKQTISAVSGETSGCLVMNNNKRKKEVVKAALEA